MRVMSGEYFGQTKAAAIVGGKKKLERLIESGKIEAVKPRNSQNGKWFCNAAQVLMHCRNMRKTGKTGKRNKNEKNTIHYVDQPAGCSHSDDFHSG